jgi:hypothetical protein
MKYVLTTITTHWEATQRVMAAKLTRLTHKIVIQLHLVVESCTICSSCSRWPVQKLLDTPSYVKIGSQDSSVSVVTKLNGLDDQESAPGRVRDFFSLPPCRDWRWGPASLLWNEYQALSPELKQPGHEADHSPPSSAEVKDARSYTSTPPYVCMAWYLVKQKTWLHGVILS